MTCVWFAEPGMCFREGGAVYLEAGQHEHKEEQSYVSARCHCFAIGCSIH